MCIGFIIIIDLVLFRRLEIYKAILEAVQKKRNHYHDLNPFQNTHPFIIRIVFLVNDVLFLVVSKCRCELFVPTFYITGI